MTQLGLDLKPTHRRVIVGFSGGVTSAWCLGWALRTYPRDEVIALFHDTKEEHPDTYRFLREMAAMYCWAEHANCIGCVKGARTYWLAVAKHHPEVFEQRAQLEEEFGHTINRGGNPISLRDLLQLGIKRPFDIREKIELGACECGD